MMYVRTTMAGNSNFGPKSMRPFCLLTSKSVKNSVLALLLVCVFSTHFLEKYSYSKVLEDSAPISVSINSRAV